jgi:hypothetical protein
MEIVVHPFKIPQYTCIYLSVKDISLNHSGHLILVISGYGGVFTSALFLRHISYHDVFRYCQRDKDPFS